jgi:signal transduction histidine kinase
MLLPLLPESKVKDLESRKNPYHLISQIKDMDEKVRQWIEFSITLTRKDRRKSKKIDLLQHLTDLKRSWARKLNDRGVALNINPSAGSGNNLTVKMIELDIDTIFDNLIANSIEAFQRDGFKGNRIIDINLTDDGGKIEIEYKDSGPGISKDIKKPEDIYKAFVTTKRDKTGAEIGTGLGMWLLKSAVDYNKGSVKLFNPEKGFQIKIKFNSQN